MSTLSEKDKQLKQWMEEIGVDPIPDLKIECIACNTKIQVDKTLNAPIGGINLISFAGPLSKYRDNSMYSTYNDKLHFFICDDCFKKNIKSSMDFKEMSNGKYVKGKLPKIPKLI